MHEGLDIAVKEANEKVFAVADGFVSDISRSKDGAFMSSVVVRDEDPPPPPPPPPLPPP